jgi:hypothetical protein
MRMPFVSRLINFITTGTLSCIGIAKIEAVEETTKENSIIPPGGKSSPETKPGMSNIDEKSETIPMDEGEKNLRTKRRLSDIKRLHDINMQQREDDRRRMPPL